MQYIQYILFMIKALEDLRRGDEILVSYNYRMEGAPEWYSELWYNHLRSSLRLNIHSYAS